MIDPATGRKTIAAGRLFALLVQLPEDAVVQVNAVGNLTVLNAACTAYLGYIDLANETVWLEGEDGPRDVRSSS